MTRSIMVKKPEKLSDLEKELRDIYTPLSVAKKEIWRRWNDKELRKKVEKFLGGDIPKVFKSGPKATIVRDIITPNTELLYFLNLTDLINLKPILGEYLTGKFVAKNYNKYHLCKMFFFDGLGKKFGDKLKTLKIVNFNKFEGKKIKNVNTTLGEKLIDLHHWLLKKAIPKIDIRNIFDISSWFNKHRKRSQYYYMQYLALFLAHGVLFDNFILGNGEGEFTRKKIIPSFHKLEKIFGIKPLVVPITPIEDEDDRYWWCYPESIQSFVQNRGVLKHSKS